MGGNKRETDIDIVGDVSQGAHFCQFYQTKEDLVDILVPYFKAGLENNEFCMWVTSEPLGKKEAEHAMRKAIPDFDRYLKKGQIEILSHTECYLKDGTFDLQIVLNGWIDKLNQALTNGYNGIRVTGNTFWLKKKDWRTFTDYEEAINNVIGKYRMLAICTYSLDKCEALEVIDVIKNHQFALVRHEGEWVRIESFERKRAEEKAQQLEFLRELNRARSELLANVSHELRAPLTAIKGYTTMLLDYDHGLRRDEKRQYLESVDKATDRLTGLVDNLLDLAISKGVVEAYGSRILCGK